MRSILTLLFGWLWFKATSKCSGLLGPVEARKQFASHSFALLTSTGHIQFVMVSHTTTGSKKQKLQGSQTGGHWSDGACNGGRGGGGRGPHLLQHSGDWQRDASQRGIAPLVPWGSGGGWPKFRDSFTVWRWPLLGSHRGRRWIATQSGAWMAWTFSGGRMPEVLATHSPLQSQLVFGWNCLFYVLWKQNNIVVTWLGHTWPRF